MPVFTRADTLRPGFSLPMEILSSIPQRPAYVTLDSLVKDFDLKGQSALQVILRGLKETGFDLRVTNHPKKGRVIAVTRQGWEHAEAAAENYWQTVWGDKKHTAQDLGGPSAAPIAAA